MAARSVLARLRQWWPELLCGGLLVLIGSLHGKDDLTFALFTGIILAVGWGLGYRRRMLPLHEKVDRMTDGVRELITETRRSEQPARPHLRVVRGKDSA